MLNKIKEFFMGKPAEVIPTPIPYKVEYVAPVAAPVVEAAPAPVVEAAPASVVDQVAVVNAAKGSAVTAAAPEKKTRKPRTPKAETSVIEKAPAKAKAPKLTVVKSEKKTKLKKA